MPFTLAITALLCLCPAAAAQVMRERPGGAAPPPACAADDKVEVTEFSLSPAQPQAGQSATMRLTVRSRCPSGTRPLNVQWEITDASDRKLAGGDAQLNPGASSTFTAAWTAAAGTHKFRGDAYAQEATSGMQNNWRELSLTVVQTSASTAGTGGGGQPRLVTQALDYQKAKVVGARFADNPDGNTLCNIGQCNWNYGGCSGGRAGHGTGVIFRVSCAPTGGRANPEAFLDFTLKNGWRVKSVEVSEFENDNGNWEWRVRPTNGSNNPYMKMHVWANAGGFVRVGVKVTIEGPEGTDPYQ